MKILGIEVETEPFSDNELDLALKSVDSIVKIDVIDLKRILEVCETIINEGYQIGYIHRYPSDETTTIGVIL